MKYRNMPFATAFTEVRKVTKVLWEIDEVLEQLDHRISDCSAGCGSISGCTISPFNMRCALPAAAYSGVPPKLSLSYRLELKGVGAGISNGYKVV
jgi:hypothetical protein